MKTLQNHALLYDVDCPMCSIYTNGFIQCNMLDKNGRKPFKSIDNSEETYVDIQRAKNEIALIDTKNKTVIYGIDSLLKVLGNSFPIIETIGKFKPIHFLLQKLYSFISYNRKVIAPSKLEKTDKECVPTFNIQYRILYILFALFITASTLFQFSKLIPLVETTTFYREALIAFGQLVFQAVFLWKKDIKTIVNYFGNIMTISLIGSLLLLPIIVVNSFITVPTFITVSMFLGVISFMLFEHIRRVKLLELPEYLSATWVLYRVLVLVVILNF